MPVDDLQSSPVDAFFIKTREKNSHNSQTMTGKEITPEAFEKEWYFETDEDVVLGIETAVYKNGNTVKRFKLSNGKEAVIRELFGRDMMKVDMLVAADNKGDNIQELYFHALYHFAVKIDGQQIPIEDFGNLKAKDYNKVKITAQTLNFT